MSNFHTTIFQNSLYWYLDLIRHNMQFLTEFAGFEILFHVVYMLTPHVRSDLSN